MPLHAVRPNQALKEGLLESVVWGDPKVEL